MCSKWTVGHVTLAGYYPESNLLAKRTIQILKALMELLSGGRLPNKRTHLAYAVMANQMIVHWLTGYRPFMMMYSWEALVSREVGSHWYQTWEVYNGTVAKHALLI